MYKMTGNRLDESLQSAFLTVANHLSATGFFGEFKVRHKPNCSPIRGDTPRLETSPEERLPGKKTAPLFVNNLC